jgi:hypothetical protein
VQRESDGDYGFLVVVSLWVVSITLFIESFIVVSFFAESDAIAGVDGAMVLVVSPAAGFFSPHAATARTAAAISTFRIASPFGLMTLVTEAGTAYRPLSPSAPGNKLGMGRGLSSI